MKLSLSSGKSISKTFSVKTIIEEHVFNSTAISDKRIRRIPLILDKVQKIIKQLKKQGRHLEPMDFLLKCSKLSDKKHITVLPVLILRI